MSNFTASNISAEISNSECPASSLISNTYEAEFADLEALAQQTPSHIQLIATNASNNDTFITASKSSDIINTTANSPFKQVIF